MWINYRGFEHFSGLVHDSQLAACAIAGVDTHHNLSFDGCRHEKVPEVFGKQLDSVFACPLCKLRAQLAFYGRSNKPLIGVDGRGGDVRICGTVRFGDYFGEKIV